LGITFNPFSPGGLDFIGNSGSSSGPANRYFAIFNSTTDWTGPSGGFYELSIAQLSHTRGVNPQIQIYELVSGDYVLVNVDQVIVDDITGDVILKVPSSPDLRFNGKVILI
jgi:hypothetical protein